MAVWLIDGRELSGLLGPLEGRSLRRTRRSDTTREPADVAEEPARHSRFEPLVPPGGEPPWSEASPVDATATMTYEPIEAPLEPLPTPPARRDGKRVPAAYTAVEGTYRDVARASLWRKMVSLVSLLGILVAIGVAVAALAGATFGALAQLLDRAVG